ncbi:hypothetical protein IGB42_03085 [Andreprevotia sp. IGB-42]|uniref:tautomerase family protein n=1 Tax=Andreprevotia sp. IGB-42 TaxID=2497473 RepID=UPI00135C49DB|nr:4-oxalocrotonate tautomerase family protein [Andreprevotia sp. IGB-42]KAF0812417.1 hypothetical protein IGB42_03085 [Andreprevotia sp. IGB-42]
MPYLNLKLTVEPSQQTAERAADILTELTHTILGKKRELTAIAVEYVPASQWFIGGKALSGQAPSFYLDIKVTDGTNTKDEKARYVREVFAAFEREFGTLQAASYVLVDDVRADAWGWQGKTQEYRYVQALPL